MNRPIRFFAKMPHTIQAGLLFSLLFFSASSAQAVDTTIKVRVLAQDAKVIGSSVGGVMITIRDLQTGQILARGRQLGDTGDTNTIIKKPWVRYENRFPDDNAACFIQTLDLEGPTPVEISAEGPLAFPSSSQKASKTLLLLPGENIEGEGILLTLHGFIVEIMSPESVDVLKEGDEFWLRVSVRMLCGCPTQPEGLWNSNQFKIKAYLMDDNGVITTKDLSYAGTTNVYQNNFQVPTLKDQERGHLEILVTVSDTQTANFGMDRTAITVEKK